jgi:hypothetical protein
MGSVPNTEARMAARAVSAAVAAALVEGGMDDQAASRK